MPTQLRTRLPNRFRFGLIVNVALALMVTTVPGTVCAGQSSPRRITLAEAMGIALRENRVLQAAKLESIATQSEADAARGALLPRLDMVENFSDTNNPPMAFSNLLAQQDFAQSNFAVDSLNHPSPLSNFQSQVRLSESLYAGGRILAAFRAAGFAADAEQWRAVRTRQEIEFAVIQAYYGAVLAEQRVDVIERALAAARAHLEETKDLLAHGVVVKADVLRTEVLAGTLEQQRMEADNRLQIAWAAFAYTLGDDRERLAPLKQPAELEQPGAMPHEKLEQLTSGAIARRPEIRIAGASVKEAEQTVTIARADYLPSVSVSAAYENDSERLTRAGNNYAVFVTGQINLFNGLATKAKLDAAMARLRRARVLEKDLTESVALEVETAYRTLVTAHETLEVARRNNAYASDALRILEDRYGSGLATNVTVLDAQTARQQADMGLAQARVGVLVDSMALELATGRSPATGTGE